MPALSRRIVPLALLVLPLLSPPPAAAQETARLPQQSTSTGNRPSSTSSPEGVRNDLRQLMRQYPPSLAEVLKLDPTLMTNGAYLHSYPALEAFFAAHPEVPRNPAYFLEFVQTADEVTDEWRRRNLSPEARERDNVLTFLSVASVVAGIAFVLLWLIRTFLAHRRWLRASKAQVDLQSRLIDRLSSSADAQAFIESASSNRLFADLHTVNDSGSRRVNAPLGRILWSVQSGIVATAAGIGLLIGRRYVPVGEVLAVPGVLAIAIGLGFVLAAGASYILSNRLGLLDEDSARTARPHLRNNDELT